MAAVTTNRISKKSELSDKKFTQALALHQNNNREKAEALYNEILKRKPNHFQTLYYYGLFSCENHQFDQAIDLLTRAIKAIPYSAKSYYNRGVVYFEQELYEEALSDLSRSIELDSKYIKAYQLKASIYKKQKEYELAIDNHNKVIELEPENPDYYNDRGIIYMDNKVYKDALLNFEKALKIDENHIAALTNTGIIFFHLKQYKSALNFLNKAISISPDFAIAYESRAMLAGRLGNSKLAMKDHEKAISLGLNDPQTLFNTAITCLSLGDYENGWLRYESRWNIDKSTLALEKRNYSQPQWYGDCLLDGKTIFLYWEQGLGDTLQFCRYIELVAELKANVIVEVQKSLYPLMNHRYGKIAQIIPDNEPIPEFDFHCPLMSLPLAFKTRTESIPFTKAAYLTSDPDKMIYWKNKLGDQTKPRIGLVWSGNQSHLNDLHRSLEPKELEPLLSEQFEFVCLHKVIRDADKPWLQSHPEIRTYCDEIEDFSDTAALCDLMDIIISVDTSVVHLAGALGKPVWLLLSFTSEWRWLHDREDSIWYNHFRIFRQPKLGSWSETILKMKEAMNLLAGSE